MFDCFLTLCGSGKNKETKSMCGGIFVYFGKVMAISRSNFHIKDFKLIKLNLYYKLIK